MMIDFSQMPPVLAAMEASSTMTIAECIVYAVQHPVVGAIVVLSVLSVVMTVLYALRVVADRKKLLSARSASEAVLPEQDSSAVTAPPKDDAALIAAITAAVAEYLDLEATEKGVAPPVSFHIVSYKRKR